ncbi:hypothetical protein VTK73DRAFT_8292 [Phialemonium thermophilum]|uniref:Uncharacterized protein n=1 Tax=Phialemonium thermophilum TaxID=223376 RepID=A0ABR3W9Z5_9PEZI
MGLIKTCSVTVTYLILEMREVSPADRSHCMCSRMSCAKPSQRSTRLAVSLTEEQAWRERIRQRIAPGNGMHKRRADGDVIDGRRAHSDSLDY